MSDNEVLDEMERTGGSFVRALAAAMYSADPQNFSKLKATFPEYWQTYHERAAGRKLGEQ